MTRCIIILLTSFFLLLNLSQRVNAQWQNGSLAIETNGNNFQSGDQLKVKVRALADIDEPFLTQLSYTFVEPVRKINNDGNEVASQEERTLIRNPGPIVQGVERFDALLLDDTLHFGEGSAVGRYIIEVKVFQGYTKERVATLHSCVYYRNSTQSNVECSTYLRSIKRVNSEQWLTFEGNFSERSRYSVTFLSNGKVIKHLEAGIYTTVKHELNISSDELTGISSHTYDILVHDHDQNCSSTLARATIPSPP